MKFRGYITANGAGTVRYRVVHNGKPGGTKEMDFNRAEGRPVLFDVEVGGGDRLRLGDDSSQAGGPRVDDGGTDSREPALRMGAHRDSRPKRRRPSFGHRPLRRLVQSARDFVAKDEGTVARLLPQRRRRSFVPPVEPVPFGVTR